MSEGAGAGGQYSWIDGLLTWARGWPWVLAVVGVTVALTAWVRWQDPQTWSGWQSSAVLVVGGSVSPAVLVEVRLEGNQVRQELSLALGEALSARPRPNYPTVYDLRLTASSEARARLLLPQAVSALDAWLVARRARALREATAELTHGLARGDVERVQAAAGQLAQLGEPPFWVVDPPSPPTPRPSSWQVRGFLIPVGVALLGSFLTACVLTWARLERLERRSFPDAPRRTPTPAEEPLTRAALGQRSPPGSPGAHPAPEISPWIP